MEPRHSISPESTQNPRKYSNVSRRLHLLVLVYRFYHRSKFPDCGVDPTVAVDSQPTRKEKEREREKLREKQREKGTKIRRRGIPMELEEILYHDSSISLENVTLTEGGLVTKFSELLRRSKETCV